jgi:hypothetical protein
MSHLPSAEDSGFVLGVQLVQQSTGAFVPSYNFVLNSLGNTSIPPGSNPASLAPNPAIATNDLRREPNGTYVKKYLRLGQKVNTYEELRALMNRIIGKTPPAPMNSLVKVKVGSSKFGDREFEEYTALDLADTRLTGNLNLTPDEFLLWGLRTMTGGVSIKVEASETPVPNKTLFPIEWNLGEQPGETRPNFGIVKALEAVLSVAEPGIMPTLIPNRLADAVVTISESKSRWEPRNACWDWITEWRSSGLSRVPADYEVSSRTSLDLLRADQKEAPVVTQTLSPTPQRATAQLRTAQLKSLVAEAVQVEGQRTRVPDITMFLTISRLSSIRCTPRPTPSPSPSPSPSPTGEQGSGDTGGGIKWWHIVLMVIGGFILLSILNPSERIAEENERRREQYLAERAARQREYVHEPGQGHRVHPLMALRMAEMQRYPTEMIERLPPAAAAPAPPAASQSPAAAAPPGASQSPAAAAPPRIVQSYVSSDSALLPRPQHYSTSMNRSASDSRLV